MDLKDLFAIIDATAGGDHVIRFAEQLARQRAGYVSGLVVGWRPSIPIVEGLGVDVQMGQWIEDVQRNLEDDTRAVRARFEQSAVTGAVEGMLISSGEARSAIRARAMLSDLSIVSRPREISTENATTLLEAALFASGRPVIVVPPAWKVRQIGRTILIAWKPTKEAARAVGDAGPLIRTADRVVVVTLDAKPTESGYGEEPGAEICAHLARGGAKVDLVNIASNGKTAAEAIQDQALAVDADLIVMGGYGRSRLEELVFGGMTKGILENCAWPVFMAH